MDTIFFPDARRWISPSTNLGVCVTELKKFVHLNKTSIVIINPSEDEHDTGTEYSMGRKRVDVGKPEYMVCSSDGEYDVETRAERLRARIEKQNKNKWAEDDAACEAAINFVGESKFFNMREKNTPQQRGRQRAKCDDELVEEEMHVNVNEEARCDPFSGPVPDKNFQDSSNPIRSGVNEYGVSADDVHSNTANTSNDIYEQFNYFGLNNFMEETILDSRDQLVVGDDENLKVISEMVPEALLMSENDNMDEFEYDDDYSNYASLAAKMELYKGMVDSDEVASGDDDRQTEVSDVEESSSAPTLTVDVDFNSCENSNLVKNATPSKRKIKDKSLRNKTATLFVRNKNVNSETSGTQNLQLVTIEKEQSGNTDSDERKEDEPVTNFKQFTNWVFKQSYEKEQERLKLRRPGLMKTLSIKEEFVKKLQKHTSAFLSTTTGEVFQDEAVLKSSSMPLLAPPVVDPSARSLQSLAVFLTHGEDPSYFPWKSVNVQQQINDDFVYDEFVKRVEQEKIDAFNPAIKSELVDKEDDFLIQLLIYQATDPEDVLPDEVKLYIEPKLAYEMHMLGSQTVQDLISAIHCENDYVYLQDIPHPDQYVEDTRHYAKKKYPSSMILIHETVYSDQSVSEMDYVSVINDWAKRPPQKNSGPFKRGNLTTKLKDLELRFGFPYVYIHLGGCEHIFVFTKSRLLHLEDDHLIKSYPKIIGMTRFKNIYCRVDNEYLARWAVSGFKGCPENPMLLCSECVLMYCYDNRKRKCGDFKIYPFTQMANIL
ncbi:unnamed protein product [Orchesella dallaii]|uniref:snRNA-activating protein complex subunit 3 n=1 Tax=Orchesella dallaii TaxID=48710 RepID=A0ABP1Q4W3_9HEXA